MLRYGKALNGPVRNPLVKLISVPKSYFTHFYIFSSIYVPSLLLLVLYYYTNHIKVRQTSSDLHTLSSTMAIYMDFCSTWEFTSTAESSTFIYYLTTIRFLMMFRHI